jgi:hypothetical protein
MHAKRQLSGGMFRRDRVSKDKWAVSQRLGVERQVLGPARRIEVALG